MDFALNDEQQLLRDTARALVTREWSTALVRAHMGDPSVADELTKRLTDWGALAEGPLVDLCLFLEECGAGLVAGPFVPTVGLYAPLLATLGDAEGFTAVTTGGATGTVAIADRTGAWVPNDGATKFFVPEADRVDHVAVIGPGPSVTVTGPVSPRFIATVDTSRRLFEVDAPPSTASTAPAVRLDPDLLADVQARWYVAAAAELIGTARSMFEMALAYAKQREQFGRPIGSFQAIQHKLANMALANESAWSAVYYAAMAIDAADPDRHRAAHVAKAAAGTAAKLAAKDGIQIHGGIGYTWEHDLHLFIRRFESSEHLLGTTEWHEDRLADLIL
ncbi:MAG: acyl-CoA dehydrogenase domain protein [Acidimicrobiales bacterium]|jgi:alkylation response protein AidB-like acyl-CoA dehydrogenase|nr:acyl-CoA dehydrogenase domain protein [Acidimicrobiales bacterium]